jgi:predicted ester cyclase
MIEEENKTLVRRLYETIAKDKDLSILDEYIAENAIDHNQLLPGQSQGVEGTKQAYTKVLQAFPDLQINIEDQIAEGDKVVSRLKMTGTHKGEFMGIPPTGKKGTASLIDIVRIAGGKVVERWGLMDQAELMEQLGLAPEFGK